jgi:hypothetical protein
MSFSRNISLFLAAGAMFLATAEPVHGTSVRQVAGADEGPVAADRRAPEALAARASGPLEIDGRLDEPAWAEAPSIRTFTQREPDEGAAVSQPTEVRILFDDDALYVGARLEDTGSVTTRLGRRDMTLLDSDWFGITLDSYHDLRTGFRFQVNPSGVQRDAVVTMVDGQEREDLSWDAVWEVATSVDESGWTVEMRIPFSQLRFRRANPQVWGLQLERIIGRRGEIAHFAFVPRAEPGGIPAYGRLVGLSGIEPRDRLEVVPYALARGEYVDPRGNPFRGSSEHGLDAGADLMYRLTPELTLNATLNPDFGQVEVDPAVVELGVYETFFPERRPFFVEGSEIFRFTGNTSGGQLFYSRRIGRAPQLAPPTTEADVPDASRILGAAKISGRPGGWSVGVMDAVSGPVEARFLQGGEEHRMVAEPLSNYFVTRVRRDVPGGRTAYGGVVTSVLRDRGASEARAALHSSAWGAGLDFRHEWDDRRWQLTGSLAGSHVRGSSDAITRTQRLPHHYFQRPDAAHLEVDPDATSLSGYSAGLNLTRQAGERWLGSLAAAATSPGYEVNDLGFAMRTDRQDLSAALTHRQIRPGDFFREWAVSGSIRAERNFDGDLVQRTTAVEAFFRHLDFWSVTLFASDGAEAWDDRSTRGGPMMIRPGNRVVGLSGSTDPRRPVSATASAAWQDGDHGGDGWEMGGSVQVRTSPWWNLSVGPYYSGGRVPAQYLATVPDAAAEATHGAYYLFAPLDFRHLRADVRLNVTLTPRLSLETYVQPLIFAFDFGEPGTLAAPRTFEFEPWEGPVPELDHTLRSLRGNAVLRWEWRPGSTLYVAWQQRRQGIGDDGSFSLGEDGRGLFAASPDDILVIKWTYWLNP